MSAMPQFSVKEMVMERIHQPSKEEVREWLRERQAGHMPLPDATQIRRELGWTLSESTRDDCDALRTGNATADLNGAGR